MGYFPTSPRDPPMAFLINILSQFHHLYDHTSNSITALAAGHRDLLEERGFLMLNSKEKPYTYEDPFRKGLRNAFQRYDLLWKALDDVNRLIAATELRLLRPPATTETISPPSNPTNPRAQEESTRARREMLQQAAASSTLRDRCPACFGLEEWGRSLDE